MWIKLNAFALSSVAPATGRVGHVVSDWLAGSTDRNIDDFDTLIR
jgi:hypothetical protein